MRRPPAGPVGRSTAGYDVSMAPLSMRIYGTRR